MKKKVEMTHSEFCITTNKNPKRRYRVNKRCFIADCSLESTHLIQMVPDKYANIITIIGKAELPASGSTINRPINNYFGPNNVDYKLISLGCVHNIHLSEMNWMHVF